MFSSPNFNNFSIAQLRKGEIFWNKNRNRGVFSAGTNDFDKIIRNGINDFMLFLPGRSTPTLIHRSAHLSNTDSDQVTY